MRFIGNGVFLSKFYPLLPILVLLLIAQQTCYSPPPPLYTCNSLLLARISLYMPNNT
ncbi:hypothetical protein WG66_007447, partial [Moniliophthora roreri]